MLFTTFAELINGGVIAKNEFMCAFRVASVRWCRILKWQRKATQLDTFFVAQLKMLNSVLFANKNTILSVCVIWPILFCAERISTKRHEFRESFLCINVKFA